LFFVAFFGIQIEVAGIKINTAVFGNIETLKRCNSVKNDPNKKIQKPLYSFQYLLQLLLGKKNQLPFTKIASIKISQKWRHL